MNMSRKPLLLVIKNEQNPEEVKGFVEVVAAVTFFRF